MSGVRTARHRRRLRDGGVPGRRRRAGGRRLQRRDRAVLRYSAAQLGEFFPAVGRRRAGGAEQDHGGGGEHQVVAFHPWVLSFALPCKLRARPAVPPQGSTIPEMSAAQHVEPETGLGRGDDDRRKRRGVLRQRRRHLVLDPREVARRRACRPWSAPPGRSPPTRFEQRHDLGVHRLDAVPRVDQQERPPQRRPPGEIGPQQRLPLRDHRPSAPRRSRSPAGRRGSAPRPSVKKLISCVRPGVFDARASALRPVSALIRLDLPTFERPAKQTSSRSAGGSPSIATTPFTKSQGPANSMRPRSSASGSGSSARRERGPSRDHRDRRPRPRPPTITSAKTAEVLVPPAGLQRAERVDVDAPGLGIDASSPCSG